jgi:hypothetical protein
MAKGKKGKKAEGKKKASGSSGSERLESRLLGYWKKGLYGEFVTAFLRQRHRAMRTQAAELWDPAVRGFLDHAFFRARDPSLLEGLLPQLRQEEHLSEQTHACLAIAEAAHDLHRGEASLEGMGSLPPAPPGPFSELRDYLARIPDRAGQSSLAEYAHGRRKNARRGEKHLADAARFSQQLGQVLSTPIRECSLTPFTQMRNKLRQIRDTIRDIRGSSSQTLTDATILSELLRELKAHPAGLSEPEDVWAHLGESGFTFSSHPFVRDLWRVLLRLGRDIQGGDWERSLRLDLWPSYPELLPGLPEHVQEQLKAREHAKRRARKDVDAPISALAATLEYDVWSRRERVVLLWALLTALHEFASEVADPLSFPLDPDLDPDKVELGKTEIARRIFDTGLELLPLIRDLAPGRCEILKQVLQRWTSAVALLPPPYEKDRLTAMADTALRHPVDTSAWLVLLLKSSEAYASEAKDPVLARIRDHVAPLSLEERDFASASTFLGATSQPGLTFRRWARCLDASSLQSLAERLLDEYFRETTQKWHPFSNDLWLVVPDDFMHELVESAGRDHPLFSLARLTLNKADRSTPLPENEKEAEWLLNHPPPDETLCSVLLWMLTYPPTASSDAFLHRIIIRLADYATRHKRWEEIALALRGHGSLELATLVWNSWEKLGLTESESDNEDFSSAWHALRPLAFKGKGKTGSGKKTPKKSPKQKSLLDSDVLQGSKNRNQGRK